MSAVRASRAGKAYLLAVPVVGLCLLGWALLDLVLHPPPTAWMALPALAALTGSFTFRIPGSVVRLTVAEPIIFTATLLYGPAAGTVAAAIDAVAMSLRMNRQLRTAHRFAFNVALLSIAIWPASTAFFHLTGVDPHEPKYPTLGAFLGPLYLFAAGVFVSNSALLAIALAIERGVSAFSIWRQQFSWVATSYFASASVAAILVVYGPSIDLALVAVLAPLLLVSYLVFKTTVGRLDDANRHLGEVNSLYLSTIETLAMAIDAKDQVTHGHIRRVQKFAVGLAKLLGVDDDKQLRAIEAAALLHDMGKLAIPEFILNKPGRLTDSEFDVMKTHAAVGADLLSAINFPYPVVPIVRHHHENWDGSGYPDKIQGVAIPIGARILSVVDCYDALTSDRPYRPAMSDDQAIGILVQRRGSMYDPLVVDTFVREYASLRADVERGTVRPAALAVRPDTPIASVTQLVVPGDSDELLASLNLLATISPAVDTVRLESVCRDVVMHLRGVAPFDTAAIFLVDESLLNLDCVYADGSLASRVLPAKIPVGEQLTGWVGAHRTSVWNSDAALDAVIALHGGADIASSMPLVSDGAFVGVLTLYSTTGQDISVVQRRAIETLMPAIGPAVASSAIHLSPVIDCRRESTRVAALAVLDSLLSHARQSHGGETTRGVLALTLTPISTDSRTLASGHDLESHTNTLTDALASSTRERVILRLSDRDVIVFVGSQLQRMALAADVSRASSCVALQTVSITSVWIDTSQSLQERIRRIGERHRDTRSKAVIRPVH